MTSDVCQGGGRAGRQAVNIYPGPILQACIILNVCPNRLLNKKILVSRQLLIFIFVLLTVFQGIYETFLLSQNEVILLLESESLDFSSDLISSQVSR